MPIAKIKMIVPDGEQHDTNRNCTYYKYTYTFPNPNGEGDDIRFGARHKIRDRFSVGDTVEYTPKGDPNWGTVQNPQQGNFQNSRPASQPAAQPAAQPSSNGDARTVDTRIEDQVIFKGAVELSKGPGSFSDDEQVLRAIKMMEAVKRRHDRQSSPAPVAADPEIPF